LNCINPVMLEKAIVALQLLAHLAESDLPIQFKGGTSLLLRLRGKRLRNDSNDSRPMIEI
jgi:hypothetical protein